jgi:hypothetical protein
MSTTYISAELRRRVEERAGQCCEYCLIHADDAFLAHEIDHIISEKHRGKTEHVNLCFSCFDCNRYEGSDIGSHDMETDTFTRLYHPRLDKWHEHFQLDGAKVIPLTAIARVTEFLLQMNTEERTQKRETLIDMQRYPCLINDKRD